MDPELRKKISQCERQQQQLWAFRPLSEDTLKSLREYYRVGLTYTSNALEGNSLTESETKIVIENGLTIEGKPLRDVYEAVGHAKAYDYLYDLSREAPASLAEGERQTAGTDRDNRYPQPRVGSADLVVWRGC